MCDPLPRRLPRSRRARGGPRQHTSEVDVLPLDVCATTVPMDADAIMDKLERTVHVRDAGDLTARRLCEQPADRASVAPCAQVLLCPKCRNIFGNTSTLKRLNRELRLAVLEGVVTTTAVLPTPRSKSAYR